MIVARRCSSGCAPWPDEEQYHVCPFCLENTTRYRGLTPLSHAEAESRRKHGEFERYYDSHIPDLEPLTDDELREMGIDLD